MTRKLTLAFAGVLAGALFAVNPAFAQTFQEWDTDTNQELSQDEWTQGFGETGIFDDWDANDDGMLEEDEFHEGVYSAYDQNDDDILDEDEFADYEEDNFWDLW